MSQIERLYWLDNQIRSEKFPNADAVSHQFGVSRRTAFADRDHLAVNLGAPVAYDRRRGGWAYTDPTYLLPFLALAEREAATLRRSLLAAREYLAEPDASPVDALTRRLRPFLPSPDETPAESVGGAIHPDGGVGTSSALLDDCRRGVGDRRRLRLLYHSLHRDGVSERVVRPHHLRHWRGEPYLIAWCEWRRGWRDFFLGRVREWALLPGQDAFARDPAFNVEAYLRGGFELRHGEALVTVRARFSPYQARWVRERRYHPSQQTVDLEGGGLEMTLSVAGTAEVRRWLLGYGAEVEVLEPAALRSEMAAEAKKLGEIYSES